ncbi:MAG: quinone oxidoreductase [Pseudomonadota bacterium]
MVKAIRIHEYGGPEQMLWEDIDVPAPGDGEIHVKHHAIGLNYIDTYHRSGLYRLPKLPAILGTEGAGEIVAVGAGVRDLTVGDRIGYANPIGSYCQERVMPADRAVKLPDTIDYSTAAAMMLQGMTVRYLLCQTYKVTADTTMLLHAAAGGVGLIACQWANHLGATIIGTAGSDEKCALAKANGATYCINYNTEDFAARVKEITSGQGCDVVYDSIGQATCPASLECLKPRGLFVTFGNASGPITNFDVSALASRGSLYMTRPTLFHYVTTRNDLLSNANELFEMVSHGHVKIQISQAYPLVDVQQAHRDLEARRTMGATVLMP